MDSPNPRIIGRDDAVVDAPTRDSLAQQRLNQSGQRSVVPNTDRTHVDNMPDPGLRDYAGTPARPLTKAESA